MSCCSAGGDSGEDADEIRRQETISRAIDLQLQEEERIRSATIKVLVVGSAGSGKSSIIKQIKIANSGYTKEERLEEGKNARVCIRRIMEAIINEMDRSEPPLVLEDPSSNAHRLQYIRDNILQLPFNYSDFPKVFYEHCDALWQDKVIRQCYSNCPMARNSLADHLMNHSKILQIADDDYEPTDDDIFKIKDRGPGTIHTTNVDVYKTRHQFLEVVNDERKPIQSCKWTQHVFDVIDAIIIVVDLSRFHEKYRIVESLEMFKGLRRNRWLRRVLFIVLFNKTHLFESKINDRSSSSVADFFPEFEFNLCPSDSPMSSEDLKQTVVDIFKKADPAGGVGDSSSCYYHFINATDTQNVKIVYQNISSCILDTLISNYI